MYCPFEQCPYPLCKEEFPSCFYAIKHVMLHLNYGYICQMCYEPFTEESSKKEHVAQNHFQCIDCCSFFQNKGGLNDHRVNVFFFNIMGEMEANYSQAAEPHECPKYRTEIVGYHLSNPVQVQCHPSFNHNCIGPITNFDELNRIKILQERMKYCVSRCLHGIKVSLRNLGLFSKANPAFLG